ncbi:MAG: hypothetical protein Q8M76_17220 [Spirochaetaceae bacterium]|nr:hypothetical protein [Spirochaetaceae bacterium]
MPIEGLYALISGEARSIFGAAATAVASYDEAGESLVAEKISWSGAQETAAYAGTEGRRLEKS